MPILDLSLSNPNIFNYLNYKSERPPVGEFMFIHTHYVEGNFVSQIEIMIAQASEVISMNAKMKGIATRLRTLAEKLGAQLSEVNEKNAPGILDTLRQIYAVCIKVNT